MENVGKYTNPIGCGFRKSLQVLFVGKYTIPVLVPYRSLWFHHIFDLRPANVSGDV